MFQVRKERKPKFGYVLCIYVFELDIGMGEHGATGDV